MSGCDLLGCLEIVHAFPRVFSNNENNCRVVASVRGVCGMRSGGV